MRACDFIFENGRTGSILPSVADALPATFALPELKNQDAYLQYRFGVALASVRGVEQRAADGVEPFYSTSAWGENQIVVSYDPDVDQLIDDALKMMGKSGKRLISTRKSTESNTVNTTSPVSNWRTNPT